MVLGLVALLALGAATWPETPVVDAAQRGDIAQLRALLTDGGDVNEAQGDGMTALHWAAYQSDAAMASMLLEFGPDLDARTRLGNYTPLHLAARSGQAGVVALLLEGGAEPGTPTTTRGAQALHFAAETGNVEAIRLLVEAGVDPDVREGAWQQSPLIFASSYGRTAAVETLLQLGADPLATTRVEDIQQRAILDRIDRERRNARMRGEPDPYPDGLPTQANDVINEDEEASRQIEDPEPLSYAELVGHQGGNTALIHAVREGFTETALALIEGGADINQPSEGTHTTPLLTAMINGHFDLGMTLLELGADPNLVDEAGTGPLFAVINTHWAPKSRYPQQQAYKQQEVSYVEAARRLLEAGANPNQRLAKHLWYMGYNFDLLQIDSKGATPFWRAAYALDVPMMRLLVDAGADPNIPTEKVPERRRRGRPSGDSGDDPSGLPEVPVGGPAVYPIHAATGVGYGLGFAANAHEHAPDGWLPAVRYLVEELGADVNARDHNGYSPIHHAAARGDNEVILYLVEQGADVTLVSRTGQTTADLANGPVQRTQPFPETVTLLEELGSHNNHNCVSC
jgi:ankyrin repeat protein